MLYITCSVWNMVCLYREGVCVWVPGAAALAALADLALFFGRGGMRRTAGVINCFGVRWAVAVAGQAGAAAINLWGSAA